MSDPVELTVVETSRSGAVITGEETSITEATFFDNTGKEFLYVVNGNVGEAVITIKTGATLGGFAIEDRTITIDASDAVLIGPFSVSVYNDASQQVEFASSVTDETVKAMLFKLGT